MLFYLTIGVYVFIIHQLVTDDVEIMTSIMYGLLWPSLIMALICIWLEGDF